MLDSNLPVYYFRPSTDRSHRYDYSVLFTQNGSEPDPRYILRFPDPSAAVAKNVYACALCDAYVPDIIYGEVLLKPDWQQPSLSAQEIRNQSGVLPPPAPLIPSEFDIQLYNPDQQVVVSEKRANWGSDSYQFSMPMFTFREPSASTLDKGTNDPVADSTTPLLKFLWKKEGTLTNNLACFLTGKSTDTNQKKKGGKEPDIIIAVLHNYRDLTLYESNFHRVEVEDFKGLEVVLLLSASVIRDVYCQQRKDSFNVGEAPRKNSGGLLGRKKSTPLLSGAANSSSMNLANSGSAKPLRPSPPPRPNPAIQQNGIPINSHGRHHGASASALAPPPDPRENWEIEAEAVRLRKQQEAERRVVEARRREKEKADEAEARRLRKIFEAEEKERRKREAEIEKETARLRKKYGDQSNMFPQQRVSSSAAPVPHLPPRPASRPSAAQRPQHSQRLSMPMYGNAAASHTTHNLLRPGAGGYHGAGPSGPYLNPQGSRPAASMLNLSGGAHPQPKPKKSFLGLRRASDTDPPPPPAALHKKKSSFW